MSPSDRRGPADDSSFLGRGWGFPPQFAPRDRETRMVSEDEDIQESLRILFSTNPGERVMRPSFGCGLRAHVFDPIADGLFNEIRDLVERAILFFEPRITLERVDLATPDPLNGCVEITVSYTIRATNTRSNLVYPFYSKEATDVL